MKKLLVIVPCGVLVACCYWLLCASKPDAKSAARWPASPSTPPTPIARAPLVGLPRAAAPADKNEPSLMPKKLVPRAKRCACAVDEEHPLAPVRTEAARLLQGGAEPRPAASTSTYHLHVADSEISISRVHVDESTLTDRNLERLHPRSVAAAHWRGRAPAHWDIRRRDRLISVRPASRSSSPSNDDRCLRETSATAKSVH